MTGIRCLARHCPTPGQQSRRRVLDGRALPCPQGHSGRLSSPPQARGERRLDEAMPVTPRWPGPPRWRRLIRVPGARSASSSRFISTAAAQLTSPAGVHFHVLLDPGAAPTAEVGTEANGPSLPRTGAAGTRVSLSPPCPRGLGDSPCHADGAVTERRRWAVGDRGLSGPATLRRALSGVGMTGLCTCALALAGCPRGLTPTEGVGPSPQAPRGSCGRGSAGPSVALSALHGPQDVASAASRFAQFTRKTRGLGPNREPWVSGHCVFLDLFQVVVGPAMGP